MNTRLHVFTTTNNNHSCKCFWFQSSSFRDHHEFGRMVQWEKKTEVLKNTSKIKSHSHAFVLIVNSRAGRCMQIVGESVWTGG